MPSIIKHLISEDSLAFTVGVAVNLTLRLFVSSILGPVAPLTLESVDPMSVLAHR